MKTDIEIRATLSDELPDARNSLQRILGLNSHRRSEIAGKAGFATENRAIRI